MTPFQQTEKTRAEEALGNLVREMLRAIPPGDARIMAIMLLGNAVRIAINALAAV